MQPVRRLVGYVRGKGVGAESIRYLIIGGLTTLLNLALFFLLNTVIGIDVTISNVTSIAVAILFAYVTNKHVVFMHRNDSREAIKLEYFYLITGGLTTLINLGLFLLLSRVMGIDITISIVVSIVVAILFAFVAIKYVIFRQHGDSQEALKHDFVKFVGSRLFTMALELGILLLFHNALGFNELLCKLVAQVLVIISNYFISKLIVFRKGSRAIDS